MFVEDDVLFYILHSFIPLQSICMYVYMYMYDCIIYMLCFALFCVGVTTNGS